MANILQSQEKGALSSYRGVLHDISRHLKKKDIAHIAFQFPKLSTAQRDNIQDGIELFDELERLGELSERNIDRLVEAVGKLQLAEPLRLLEKYKADYVTEPTRQRWEGNITYINTTTSTPIVTKDDLSKGSQPLSDDIKEKDKGTIHSIEITSDHESYLVDSVSDRKKDLNEDFMGCSKHRSFHLDKYCETCDTQICAECVFDFHNVPTCKVVAVTDISKKIREERHHLLSLLKSIEIQCLAIENENRVIQEFKSSQREVMQSKVFQRATKMHDLLEENKERLLSELDNNRQNAEEEYDKKVNVLQEFQARLRHLEEELHGISGENIMSIGEIHELKLSLEGEVVDLEKKEIGFKNDHDRHFSLAKVPNDCMFCELQTFVLIGSVMIHYNHLVHVFDGRTCDGRIHLICNDPNNPAKEYFRYVIKVKDLEAPVVVSNAAIWYQKKYHVVFSVGHMIYIVHPQDNLASYDCVESVSSLNVQDDKEQSWISNIAAQQPMQDPRDVFLVSFAKSTKIYEYRTSGHKISTVAIEDIATSVTCIAKSCCNNILAIIDPTKHDVLLLSCSIEVKKEGTLPSPVFSGTLPLIVITAGDENNASSIVQPLSIFNPISVLWACGYGWVVLFVSVGNEIEWKVALYKERGDFVKVCASGKSLDETERPVNISYYQEVACVILKNRNVINFTLKQE